MIPNWHVRHCPPFLRVFPLLAAAMLNSCAAPALKLYTFAMPPMTTDAASARPRIVIEVSRVSLPDYLDTQDILLRRGNTLERSSRGRWASRLSLTVTDLLRGRLAADHPDALVTDQAQIEPAKIRVVISISRLEVSADGKGLLEGDWIIIPRDGSAPLRHERARFAADGPVSDDQDVVDLQQHLLDQFTAPISLGLSNDIEAGL